MTKEFLTACIKILHYEAEDKKFRGMCSVVYDMTYEFQCESNKYPPFELDKRINDRFSEFDTSTTYLWPLDYDGMQKRVRFLSQWRDELENENLQTLTIHG